MHRLTIRVLAIAGVAAGLPLAACHNNDRDDASYRDVSSTRDTRYDPNYQADHRDYDRTVHTNAADRGTGEAASTSFNRLTGNLSTSVDAGIDRVQMAAEKALTDLHYVITERKVEDSKSVIEA